MGNYSNLFSRQNTVFPEAYGSIDFIQPMDELDAVPTIEELGSGTNHLSNGKTPGADNIPPDLIALLLTLYKIADVGRKGKSHRTCVMPK